MNSRSTTSRLRAAALPAIPKTYADLLRCVKHAWFTGRHDADQRWLQAYHDVGGYINVHLLHHRARAKRGAKVYASLAADTGISERSLREYAQFHRCVPNWRTCANLGWSRARLLCQLDDAQARDELRREALQHDWAVHQLEARVRALNAAAERHAAVNGDAGSNGSAELPAAGDLTVVGPAPKLLAPRRGLPGRYRVIDTEDGLSIDIGFKQDFPLTPAQARHRTAGEIVDVASDGSVSAAADGKPADLFTYRARVRRVIDGDTLEVRLFLPHYGMREKLRLRAIDCPEMDTAKGKAAKRVVDALALEADEVIVTTSKVDKYDRYLADVHLRLRSGEEVFLNNHLLAHGHAQRADSSAAADFVP